MFNINKMYRNIQNKGVTQMNNIAESKSRKILTNKRLAEKNHRQNLLKRSLQGINANHCLNCCRQFS